MRAPHQEIEVFRKLDRKLPERSRGKYVGGRT